MFVVGAVLTFALNVSVDWINLDLVGYLFMGAGIVVVIIGLIMVMRRRTSVVTEHTAVDATSGESITERATKVDPLA